MKDNILLYICDDNVEFANMLKKEIALLMGNERSFETHVLYSGAELLDRFDKRFPDAVLLDIDMPGMDGFEVASSLQKRKENILILFVTSHEDKVYQTYDYHPFWFVRKSHLRDLKTIFPKLLKKIDTESLKERHTCNLQTVGKTVEIDLNTLLYIESYKNDIIIHDKVLGERRLRCKLADAEKQLYPMKIIRVQYGILVNLRFVSKITSREVILTDGTSIGLGRSKTDFVKHEYQTFVRSGLL